jgi:hypothetical protein
VLLWVLHRAQTAANRSLTHHDPWKPQRSRSLPTRQLLNPLLLEAAVGQLQTQPKMPCQLPARMHPVLLLLLLLVLHQQDHSLLLLPPHCPGPEG